MPSEAQIIWLTGLSGSGKSTLAQLVSDLLSADGSRTWILDGDEVRACYPEKLGFTRQEIMLNNRNILSMCTANSDKYDVIIVPVISPYRESREQARQTLGGAYHEVYVDASIRTLGQRDTKGLYAMAAEGKINNLIGVSEASPYEVPENPELHIVTDSQAPEASAHTLYTYIKGVLR